MNAPIPVKDVTPKKRLGAHIYVRKSEGLISNIRRSFNFLFVLMFAGLPWIQLNGQQAVLLDIYEQRFHLFTLTLWPQDLTLLAYIFIVGAFALFFVTSFAGRVWCGFMCPQTVWTLAFIWFEEKLEGNRNKRMQLDKRKMDLDKFWRKGLKHAAWLFLSLLTAMTFVGYFTPINQLVVDIVTFDTGFWSGFSLIFFTVCTYGNAGWMREIMCTHMCPYARFQSVMFDKDTLTVSYDAARGENRGPRSRKLPHEDLQSKGLGDCVDCNLCVQVCPTGIDIRNGLQYECINCGACVDACDDVMTKMKYPKGLIRFSSENQLAGIHTKIVRPKLVGYFAVLLVMVSALMFDIALRVPHELDIIRDRNSLYRETNDGLIENVYTLKVLNKSQQYYEYEISISGLQDAVINVPDTIRVAPGELLNVPISVSTHPDNIAQRITDIDIALATIDGENSVIMTEPSRFIYR